MAIIIGPVTDPGLTVGEPVTVTVAGETDFTGYSGEGELLWSASGLPAGLTLTKDRTETYGGWLPAEITGTPTEGGTGTATITASDESPDSEALDWPWTVGNPPLEVGTQYSMTLADLWARMDPKPVPTAFTIGAENSTVPPGMTLTDSTLSGTPTTAGEYSILIRYENNFGNLVDTFLILSVTGTTDPDPDPEAPTLAEQLAPKVLIFAGRKVTEDSLTLAIAHTEVVADFVHGYTRGQGWYVNDPVPALRSVIVSAAARLVNNPGQLSYYGIADYNERPAVLNGYTLTELGVLHNYRRRSA